jgi:hypothetical protein
MEGAQAYEEEHVHSVYEEIASHFSSTRYKVPTLSPTLQAHAHSSMTAMASHRALSQFTFAGLSRRRHWLWKWQISADQQKRVHRSI